jgi:hypothetical protein
MNIKTAAALAIALFTGCTQQERAKNYGGTAVEVLPAQRKLINVTWKDDHLWYLTRPMVSNDVAETYEFKESSSYGLLNGTVVIKETK